MDNLRGYKAQGSSCSTYGLSVLLVAKLFSRHGSQGLSERLDHLREAVHLIERLSMTVAQRTVAELRKGSPSFVVTALVTAVAWWISHTVDRVTTEPTLEYRIEKISNFSKDGQQAPCQCVVLTVENLSSLLFKGVRLELTSKGGHFTDLVAFVSLGEMSGSPESVDVGNDDLAVTLGQLQPGAKFQIIGKYTGAIGTPEVFVASSEAAIHLTTPSLQTYFARHEGLLLGLLLILLAAFATIVVTGLLFESIVVAATLVFIVTLFAGFL